VFMAVFSLMEELRGAYIEAYINIGDTSSADFEDVLYSGLEAGLVLSAVISLSVLLHFMKCHREHVLQFYQGQATFLKDLLSTPAASVTTERFWDPDNFSVNCGCCFSNRYRISGRIAHPRIMEIFKRNRNCFVVSFTDVFVVSI
ncbi:hypothetical protein pdam_00024681, partial [Pocillopora damicornis]